MAIPKRIILTAKTRDVSRVAQGCLRNIALLHPDWEVRFFDDREARDFVAREFPEHLAVFEGFPKGVQRADFFRYLAIYQLGGFYFDLDVLLAKSVLPLVEHHCVFPFEWLTLSRYLRQQHGMDWELGNYAFGAAPGHPFLKAVIDNCVEAQRNQAWAAPMMADVPGWIATDFWTLNTTGPGLLTRTFAENRAAAARDVTILFPEDVCSKEGWFGYGDYGIHLMEGSWRHNNQRLLPRTGERWWKHWRMRQLFPESYARGPRRDPAAEPRLNQPAFC